MRLVVVMCRGAPPDTAPPVRLAISAGGDRRSSKYGPHPSARMRFEVASRGVTIDGR